MTTWSELDDLGLDGETDEYDPLNPLSCGGSFDAPEGGGEDDVFGGERIASLNPDGSFNLSAPFADPTGTVRLWIDEDANIVKARLSPSWRDRFGKVGRSAEDELVGAIKTCFMQINNFRQDWDEVDIDGQQVPEAAEPLTWEALGRLNGQVERLASQLAELGPDEGYGELRGEGSVGTAARRKLAVEISPRGLYADVKIDRTWLAESRVSQITDALVEAAADARDKFVPAVYEPGERDQISSELQSVRSQMRSLMRRGFY